MRRVTLLPQLRWASRSTPRAFVSEQLVFDTSIIVPGGETVSSATAVRPECGDRMLMSRAAVVALAGRAARRRQWPASDPGGGECERSDLSHVLAHLGLPEQHIDAAEVAFAAETEQAKLLFANDDNWQAVEAVAALLIERSEVQSTFPLLVSVEVGGEEVTTAIAAAGIGAGSWSPRT
jgi:hypothetical protein